MISDYAKFLESKQRLPQFQGIEGEIDIHPMLYPFQADITRWALRRGRACLFEDCGLGKTFQQVEWARHIPGPVLMVSPLGVAKQTVVEAARLGVEVKYVRDHKEVSTQISICNYEMLDHFDLSKFTGVDCDESSIIKDFTGKTRNQIIEGVQCVPYRLAATATPAPNDYMELGNHAEFVGAMTRTEMLSTFFIHDGGDTSKWRLKGHAQKEFWRWVCSWAVMLRKPSDLGYEDNGFILPELHVHEHIVSAPPSPGELFPIPAKTMRERSGARRVSIDTRAQALAEIVNASNESWIIWCNLNNEADAAESLIAGAVQITGSESIEAKERKAEAFKTGEIKKLVTKPGIFGHGMNWQHCANVAYLGLSDSWEDYYQSVRRCWRFGQTKEVNAHIIISETEGRVLANIKRKEADAAKMSEEMVNNMHELNATNLKSTTRTEDVYERGLVTSMDGALWQMHLGDCVEVMREMKDGSIGFSVFSPPFASLYTYSASIRDMGNCRDYPVFFEGFGFAIKELFRVMQPDRNVSVHCINLPTTKTHHGYIGIQDFRGDIIRLFQESGFVYHSEVCIWKDPVTAMQRTHAMGLLFKELLKDSTVSRQGIPDYLVTFKKPGENVMPIAHEKSSNPDDLCYTNDGHTPVNWQKIASPIWTDWKDSPVWMDIKPGDTITHECAREEADERHICPLQKEVIRRALILWSNPGDVVLSPFGGIGSEGYMAILNSRKYIGIELKKSYWKQAVENLKDAERKSKELTLI